MTLQYKLQVKGLSIGGHPHQEFASNEINAFTRFDALSEFYPEHEVVLSELEEIVIKRKPKPPAKHKTCPRGHDGLRNGKPAVDNADYCTVCGERAL